MKIDSYVSERHRKRKKRKIVFFGVLGIFALYFCFFAIVWFFFRAPLFRVDKVVVTGNSAVASSDVVALLQSAAAPRANWVGAVAGFDNMFLWPDAIATSTLAMDPQIATATVSKDYWSHTVTIAIAERAPFGIWCFGASGPCDWFDDEGVIFEKAGATQGALIPTVIDTVQSSRGLNQEVLDPEFTPNLVSIIKVVQASGLSVQSITLPDLSLEQIDVHLTNGPVIYFSLRFPADNDLPVIQSIMKQSDFSRLQYIDCTTENRVYYK